MTATPPVSKRSAERTVIYLVRHGQTPLNQTDVLRGRADPSLDETGRIRLQVPARDKGPLRRGHRPCLRETGPGQ
jgi:hypothetical protein